MDFVHVDDTLQVVLLAVNRLLRKMVEPGEVEDYNLVHGKSHKISELVSIVLRVTDSASPLQYLPPDTNFPAYFAGVPSKAMRVLGYLVHPTTHFSYIEKHPD